jgi:hypothetical protein
MTEQLTDSEREMLDFEATFWLHRGAKHAAIRELFGVSATRYYQRLIALVTRDEALAYAPMTVHRLRRLYRVGRPRRLSG